MRKRAVRVTLYRHQGQIAAFRLQGHAGHRQIGRNLVCAAVSALAQGAVLGLTEHCGLAHQLEMKEGNLYFALSNPTLSASEQATAITQTLLLSLQSVQRGHPKEIIIVEEAFPCLQ